MESKSKSRYDPEMTLEDLHAVIESSYDGILVTDGKGKILVVNQAYLNISGLPEEGIIGKNIQEFVDRNYLEKSVALMAIEKKETVTCSHTNLPSCVALTTANPFFDKNGKISLVITNVRDMTEIYRLREELERAHEMENIYYSHFNENRENKSSCSPIAVSNVMKEVLALALKVSPIDVTVLILGESGVGKEVVAKYIHDNSSRKEGPFITINCGAIPEQLLESELFGYVGGAFTGALKTGKIGLFEAAQGGTLFLDEIGELPLNLQVKLLRVLETHEVTRIGSTTPIPVDIRILAATNRDIDEMVHNGSFRDDLFYRLNVIRIQIPPLHDRIEDIAPLSINFLNYFNERYHDNKRMSYEVLKHLERHDWPGNIRELKNVIERLVVVSNGQYLQSIALPWYKKEEGNDAVKVTRLVPLSEAIDEVEKKILIYALEEYRSSRKIASAIGVDQSTVIRKLKKYGLSLK